MGLSGVGACPLVTGVDVEDDDLVDAALHVVVEGHDLVAVGVDERMRCVVLCALPQGHERVVAIRPPPCRHDPVAAVEPDRDRVARGR